MTYTRSLLRTLVFALTLGTSAICPATEPLPDTLTVGEHNGIFFPDECCWVGLPQTEKFRAAYIKEFENYCSAIGGIVGRFRLAEGKIWLIGLHNCDGDIPLEDIYPELSNPAFASWLNGVFFAKINRNHTAWCPPGIPIHVYHTTLRLKIENGVVTDMQRQENDIPTCQDIESRKATFPYDQWRGSNP